MGVGTSDVGWSFLGDLRPERRSVVPRVVLGPMILHTGLFGTGRGDPMRPLQRPRRGAPYNINGAWRSLAVSYPITSTSDARSAADLVARADVASSQVLSWLTVWRGLG
ncbi:hypothetical protein GW17_00051763 [Ensete ventricosum]|nr:hypothetical protein GW17_00051763 [Ensete ventricosum]